MNAPAVHYATSGDSMQGYLILDLEQDTYALWFQNKGGSAYAQVVCPPANGGTYDSQWGVRVGGLTDYLPFDETKQSIDGVRKEGGAGQDKLSLALPPHPGPASGRLSGRAQVVDVPGRTNPDS